MGGVGGCAGWVWVWEYPEWEGFGYLSALPVSDGRPWCAACVVCCRQGHEGPGGGQRLRDLPLSIDPAGHSTPHRLLHLPHVRLQGAAAPVAASVAGGGGTRKSARQAPLGCASLRCAVEGAPQAARADAVVRHGCGWSCIALPRTALQRLVPRSTRCWQSSCCACCYVPPLRITRGDVQQAVVRPLPPRSATKVVAVLAEGAPWW